MGAASVIDEPNPSALFTGLAEEEAQLLELREKTVGGGAGGHGGDSDVEDEGGDG